jgi:hypothetical protein
MLAFGPDIPENVAAAHRPDGVKHSGPRLDALRQVQPVTNEAIWIL